MADLPAEGCRDSCGGGGGGFTSRAWASWRWCCWICCCRLVIVRATWQQTRARQQREMPPARRLSRSTAATPGTPLAGPTPSPAQGTPRLLRGEAW